MLCIVRLGIGRRAVEAMVVLALTGASATAAADAPGYDVPQGFKRCPNAEAWHGFFKWASAHHVTCHDARGFVRAYGRVAARSDEMPRRVRGFACRVRTWRNEDGDIYASRHTCTRDEAVVRFYGMV